MNQKTESLLLSATEFLCQFVVWRMFQIVERKFKVFFDEFTRFAVSFYRWLSASEQNEFETFTLNETEAQHT